MKENSEKALTMKLIPIVDMDCPTCVATLEKEILKLRGTKEARANYITKMVKVTYDSSEVRLANIEAAIERAGYRVAYKKYPSISSKLKLLFNKEKQNKVTTISDTDFASKVLHASKPVAILFESPTCPACKTTEETFKHAAEDLKGRAELYEMDITNSETWRNYNLTVTPTLLIFIDGQLKETLIGLIQEKEIINILSK